MISMKTLMYSDRQLSRPDSFQHQSMGTIHKKIQSSLKRIANETQSGCEKARKPCGVSLKLIGGELKGREGMENGRRVWGFVLKAAERPHSELVIPVVSWLSFLQAQPAITVAITITFNQPISSRVRVCLSG